MIGKFFRIVFLAIIAWFAGLAFFDYTINHFKVDTQTKTDAIVVLTGGRHRIAEAVNLLNKGMGDKLFISGVQKNISIKELERREDVTILTNREITLDKKATNTVENAEEANFWIESNNITSIRLVTSNYHLLRSLVEFRRLNGKIAIVLHPVFSEKVATSWWRSFKSFRFLAMEYNKFLFASLRALIDNRV